jgi:hypothetical protein
MSDPTNTFVGHIGRIEPDFVGGWAADTAHPDAVVEVVVYVDGTRVAQVACNVFRPDLRDLKTLGQGNHGFRYSFPEPIPPHMLNRIVVRFALTGAVVANGERLFAGRNRLNAVLITAPGRSGTTLMMSRLALSPQIAVAETPPFEVRLLSYWATVVRTLTGAADHERSTHPDKLEGNGFQIGSNPFSHRAFRAVFRHRELEAEYFQQYASSVLSDTARTLVQEYYERIATDRQKPRPKFFAEKNNNLHRPTRLFARSLFPDLKEIVLVRDPRDLLCSQLSYFRREPEQALRGIANACRELARITEEEAGRVIVVRYEDMIVDADRVFRELSHQLGVQFPSSPGPQERSVFDVHATSASPEASIGRWRSDLSAEQKAWCDAAVGPFMPQLGYSLA